MEPLGEHWQANVTGLDDVDLLRALDALEAEAQRRHLIPKKTRPMGAPVVGRKL